MGMPSRVAIHEVGPREGFQFESTVVPTSIKAQLIEALAQTGLRDIEVASFVRPDVVPQMADAEALVSSLRRFDGVVYTGTYLNRRGFDRAAATGAVRLKYGLTIAASETFSIQNQRADHRRAWTQLDQRAAFFCELGVRSVSVGVATAFGCNYEGDIPFDRVTGWIDKLVEMAAEHTLEVEQIRLLDTMGWANPLAVSTAVEGIARRWPSVAVSLHLHDTRGLGMANAYAALAEGVEDFDTAVGGLGGCPFAGHRGAAGNIATEDFVLMCQEMGIETGVDLDALIACAELAERIVGHPLPGKVKIGGNPSSHRSR